jgi:glyoxylase-like metal-dependent hydrolase (beta-lactamase superfamily II)
MDAKTKLVYPIEILPATGETQEVAPGVLWIRMPLPLALSHINLWAIRDDAGWAIVDSGLRTPETTAAWCQLFEGALGGLPVTRVFVTHMHPDHIGMAGWITRKFGCRLWITRLEYLSCRALACDIGREAPDDGVRFYRRAGWSDAAMEHYRASFGNFGRGMYALPDSFRRLEHGEQFMLGEHEWRVVVGNGHSPEHACMHCPELKLFISGDQVLPRISSNVSVYPTDPDADPMSDWFDSIARIKREVPDDVLVLPAHNEPFLGLHDRLDGLAQSQERAFDRLREHLGEPRRVTDMFDVLFTRKVGNDRTLLGLATGETVACLNYLIRRGEVVVESDRDGIDWYRRAPAGMPGQT